ncbi:MAG: TVP38/TMEM64 family protein [Phycisphaeraceae bacterium]
MRDAKLPTSDPPSRGPEPKHQRPADAADPSSAAPPIDDDEPGVLDVERRVMKWWHPVLLLAALALLYWFADVLGLRSMLQTLRDWAETLGAQGPVLFVLVYVVLTMLWIPGSWLTLAAGALFGSIIGVIAVFIASSISAMLSFLVARHWLRARLEPRLGRSKRFRQLNQLTDRHGPATVLVVRLVNLFPFALINYGFGLTRIRFRTYLLWSLLGKLPGTVLMVVGVDAIVDGLVEREVPWDLVVIVLVMVALLVVALRFLHRRIQANSKNGQGD